LLLVRVVCRFRWVPPERVLQEDVQPVLKLFSEIGNRLEVIVLIAKPRGAEASAQRPDPLPVLLSHPGLVVKAKAWPPRIVKALGRVFHGEH
jgi:hypothetical protein